VDPSPDADTRLGPDAPRPAMTHAFAPGTILDDRYRVVALLGRGGMGEVYRADDLRLGQSVALKFLPELLADDPLARELLVAEARHARDVAHPNVCRVYDIGELGGSPVPDEKLLPGAGRQAARPRRGRTFLTMEYIDGEDLATLLRRIGKLPSAKALEIARQLCAGLAAAHDRGLLHRDLKPSNVMIDGRGHARITDFGLAVRRTEGSTSEGFAGTPAYMSPERLRGAPATAQSDLYALGLILYETFTGQPAVTAGTADDWRRAHASSIPRRPSAISRDVEPAVERVILQCLEKQPERRPRSAAHAGMMLPGGDPLAALVAAGETPSPETVAAAGAEGTVRRSTAWALLAICLASLSLAAVAWQWTGLANLVPFDGGGEDLRARARTVLRDLGYQGPVRDEAWWIVADDQQLRLLASRASTARRFADAGSVMPTPLSFRYRQSPADLKPLAVTGIVRETDPPPEVPQDALVQLDSLGRLTLLRVVPPARDSGPGAVRIPDWKPLLTAARLNPSELVEVAPLWVPPVAFDARQAWTGTVSGEPIRFEAAAYQGRVVFGAWREDRPEVSAPAESEAVIRRLAATAVAALWMVGLAAVALLARHNVRMGRGDRRGALRVAALVLVISVSADMLFEHWVPDLSSVWSMLRTDWGLALFGAATVWLFYMGLEPFVRRTWPQLLIGWTRLVDARWRDPLVGQGILAGVVFGALMSAVGILPETCGRLLNLPGTQPYYSPASLGSTMGYVASMGGAPVSGVTHGLGLMAIMVILRFVLRSDRAAFASAALVATTFSIAAVEPRWLDLVQAAVIGVSMVVFVRGYGLLGLVTGIAVNFLIRMTPWTLDGAKWFAWRPGLTVLIVMALAVWGFRNVLGRQSAFPRGVFEQ
jgi:hypothetical protein